MVSALRQGELDIARTRGHGCSNGEVSHCPGSQVADGHGVSESTCASPVLKIQRQTGRRSTLVEYLSEPFPDGGKSDSCPGRGVDQVEVGRNAHAMFRLAS